MNQFSTSVTQNVNRLVINQVRANFTLVNRLELECLWRFEIEASFHAEPITTECL